jgi:hypothetical protein
MDWPCMDESKSSVTCSDITESYRKKDFGKTNKAAGRFHKKV